MAAANQKYFRTQRIFKWINNYYRNYSNDPQNINLVGRDITNPEFMTQSEIKTLLWTTKEMKTMKNKSNPLNPYHACLLFSSHDFRQQISFQRASLDLGLGSTAISNVESIYETDMCDVGRSLSKLSDVLVTFGFNQSDVQKLADGSNVSVINASCDQFSIQAALTYLYTLLEVMGPLRRKCLAWIGPANSLCNTFLHFGPKLGIDIKIFCPDNAKAMTSLNTQRAFRLCQGQSGLHECASMEEAIYRSDIIVTTIHDNPQCCITTKVIEEAALDWYFLHTLPRSQNEVADEVFKHKNNLTWKSVENSRYVAMALLLRIFQNNVFSTSIPDFDGEYKK